MHSTTMNEKKVLTIAMLGTSCHRDADKSLLTSFIESIDGYAHLIDGPGAAAPSGSKNKNPMLGTYDFSVTGIDKTTKKISSEKTRSTQKNATEIGGLVKGSGCNDAIKEALQVVDAMIKAGEAPLVLNLAGFSRGADTMLRLCNVLSALYSKEQLEVNLFAIDPVPGPGRQKARKARVVPDNVKHCMVIGMRDEGRSVLRWQGTNLSVQNPAKTHLEYRLYHGDHGSGNYFNADSKTTNDTPYLLRQELMQFAEAHGTKLKGDTIPAMCFYDAKVNQVHNDSCRLVPDPARVNALEKAIKLSLVEKEKIANVNNKINDSELQKKTTPLYCYTRMADHANDYAVESLGKGRRDFIKHPEDYCLHGNGYFLDKQHMLLFSKRFPRFFDYFFQQNKEFPGRTDSTHFVSLQIEIDKMKNEDPDLYTSVKSFFSRNNIDCDNFPFTPPQGIPVIAKNFYDKNNKVMQLWEGVKSVTNTVIEGNDDSISQSDIKKFHSKVYEIVISDNSDERKIDLIHNEILRNIFLFKENKLFSYKLAAILSRHDAILHVAILCLEKTRELNNKKSTNLNVRMINELIDEAKKSIYAIRNNPILTDIQKQDQVEIRMDRLLFDFKQIAADKKILKMFQDFSTVQKNIPNIQLYAPVKHSMQRYLDRIHWSRNQVKKSIAESVRDMMDTLHQNGYGFNPEAIKQVLGAALLRLGELRTQQGGHQRESSLEKQLRQNILNISTHFAPNMSQADEDKIKTLLANYKNRLGTIQQPLKIKTVGTSSSPLENVKEFDQKLTLSADDASISLSSNGIEKENAFYLAEFKKLFQLLKRTNILNILIKPDLSSQMLAVIAKASSENRESLLDSINQFLSENENTKEFRRFKNFIEKRESRLEKTLKNSSQFNNVASKVVSTVSSDGRLSQNSSSNQVDVSVVASAKKIINIASMIKNSNNQSVEVSWFDRVRRIVSPKSRAEDTLIKNAKALDKAIEAGKTTLERRFKH